MATSHSTNPCHFDERRYDDPIRHLVASSSPAEQKRMTNIIEMLESGITGLTLSLKIEDLREFAHLLIEKTKEQLLPVMVSASHEGLLTKKEVLEKFNVCHTTLWNWERLILLHMRYFFISGAFGPVSILFCVFFVFTHKINGYLLFCP